MHGPAVPYYNRHTIPKCSPTIWHPHVFFSCFRELLDSTVARLGPGDTSRQPDVGTHTGTVSLNRAGPDLCSGRRGVWLLGHEHLNFNPLPSFLDSALEGDSSVNQSGQV